MIEGPLVDGKGAGNGENNMTTATNSVSAFEYYPRLRQVKSYVEQHLDEAISLARVANEVGLSRTYFSKYFYDKSGRRFSDWLVEQRIGRARDLLRSQDYSITEVADITGFQDLRTFERNFKRHTGMTPMQYKKWCRHRVICN